VELQQFPKVGEGFQAPPVTLCEWCGNEFAPTRRGSPQRFCKPSHRVAAHRATKQGAVIGKPRPRRHRTRRTEYPHGCWQHQDACLVLHHECACKRCRYNVCECIQIAPSSTTVSVPVSGLLVAIPGRYKL
jgi:hypothetical protein